MNLFDGSTATRDRRWCQGDLTPKSTSREVSSSPERKAAMLKSVEGIFRDGKIELLEPAPQVEESRVVVTFLPLRSSVDLAERGIDPVAAADLRTRLRAFANDWDRPEMDVYDEV